MENRHVKYRIQLCAAVIAAIATVFTLSAGAAPATSQKPSKPATVAVGSHPIGVAVDTGTHEAFVTDSADGTVSVIDPATRKVKHTAYVGAGAGAIVVDSEANQAYLVRSPNWLTVLDTETYAVTANIAAGNHPSSVAFDGAFVYVTNFLSNTLSVVDPRSGTVARTLPVGRSPIDVAVDPVRRHIYVTNLDSHDLWIIDTPFGDLIQKVQLGGSPTAVTVDPKTSVIYLVDRDHYRMVALDPTTYSLIWSAPIGAWVVDVQLAASAGQAGRLLLPDQNGAKVTVVDLQRRRVIRTVPVGNTPTFAAADGGTGYVTNQSSKSVSLFPI
jgi:YVTN family beta-propeller protein